MFALSVLLLLINMKLNRNRISFSLILIKCNSSEFHGSSLKWNIAFCQMESLNIYHLNLLDFWFGLKCETSEACFNSVSNIIWKCPACVSIFWLCPWLFNRQNPTNLRIKSTICCHCSGKMTSLSVLR